MWIKYIRGSVQAEDILINYYFSWSISTALPAIRSKRINSEQICICPMYQLFTSTFVALALAGMKHWCERKAWEISWRTNSSGRTVVSDFITVSFDSGKAELVACSDKYSTLSLLLSHMAKFWQPRLLILSACRQRRCISLCWFESGQKEVDRRDWCWCSQSDR